MAFASVAQAATASEKVSDTALAFSPTAQLDAGNLAVVWVATDNIATVDGQTTDHTLTDSKSNTWTKIREQTETVGVAADGATGSLWMSKIATTILTSDTLTLTLPSAVTAKACVVWEYTMGAGTPTLQEVAVNQGAGDPASITVGSTPMPSREYLLIHLVAMENIIALTEAAGYTKITDTGTTGGVGDTNITVMGGWRIATLTADTIDAATFPDREHVQFLAAIYEAGGVSHSGLAAASGGGSAIAQGRKGGQAAGAAGSGGASVATGQKGGRGLAGVSAGGQAQTTGLRGASAASSVGSGGAVVATGRSGRLSVALVSGGGSVVVAGSSVSLAVPVVTHRTTSGPGSGRTSTGPVSGRTSTGPVSGRTSSGPGSGRTSATTRRIGAPYGDGGYGDSPYGGYDL